MFVFLGGRRSAQACLKLFVGCIVFTAVLLRAGTAEASHFRYGTINWNVLDPVNAPRTVTFTVVTAWRSTFIGSTTLTFGDGADNGDQTGTNAGSGVDAIGNPYAVLQYTATHTYASNGPFTAQFTSAARVASLVNGDSSPFTVQTQVALGGSPVNTAGPISASPPIIQLEGAATRSYTFPTFDADLDPVGACRFGTSAESGLPVGEEIPTVPANGAVPVLSSVSNGCRLTWDLSQAVIGQQYVIHIIVESTHGGVISSTAIDLIGEIVTPPPPVCVGTAIFNVSATQTVTAPTTATWGTVGNASVTLINTPAGATLAPGGSGATPFSNTFSWTPALVDRGTTKIIIVNYTSAQNLGGACFVTVNVAACAICSGSTPICDPPTRQCIACGGDNGSAAASACPSTANPFCSAGGACTTCTVDADCTVGTHAGPFCNVATGACGTTCFSDAACGVGNWCDDVGHAGVCEPKLANGQTVPGSLCTVPLGARACTAGVCDPDAACGYANGHGPCALADQATVCRSALCSVSLACRPAGGCLVDGDCSSVQFCNTQTFACTARIANGVALPMIAGHDPVLDGTCSAAVGTAVCQANVCSADNSCGYANGVGPCTSLDAAVLCRSGSCSVSLACKPVGGCLVDADCASTDFCNTQTLACITKIANGSPLPTIAGHAPNLDGTCSTAVGTAVCQAGVCDVDNSCGYANRDGPCTSMTALTLCRSGSCSVSLACKPASGCLVDADCTSTDFCNTQSLACTPKIANGFPVPTILGHAPNLDGTCSIAVGVAVCVVGVCDTDDGCGYADGHGSCTVLDAIACRSGACSVSGICRPAGGCLIDEDCATGQFCDTPARLCAPKVGNGGALPQIPGHSPVLDGTCTSAAAVATCVSGVCDTDGNCGHGIGRGPCNQLTATTVCRSGACSVSFVCMPGGGCLVDGDCSAGQFCNTQTDSCSPKIVNGISIPTIAGHTPALSGTCSPDAGSAVCVSAVCDLADNACGFGNGHGVCSTSNAGTVCRLGVCDVDAKCGLADGSGPCTSSTAAVCRSAVCSVSGACQAGNGCLVDGDCASVQFCNTETRLCVGKLTNGSAIPALGGHAPALTGTCTADVGRSVCVSGVCDSQDNACGYVQSHGPCTTLNAAVCRSGSCSLSGLCRPPNGCLVDGDCGSDEFCNTETSTCTSKIANSSDLPIIAGHSPPLLGTCSVEVGTAVCASGICDVADNKCGFANGDGTCAATPAPQCRSLVCDQGQCGFLNGNGPCANNAQCISNKCDATSQRCTACLIDPECSMGYCNAASGTCKPAQPNGAPCDRATQCQSVCFSDGLCGKPDEQSCTSATDCRSAVCANEVCGVPGAGVPDGGAPPAGTPDGGGPGASPPDDGGTGTDASSHIATIHGGGCSCSTTKEHDGDRLAALGALLALGIAIARRRAHRSGETVSHRV